MSFSPKRIFSAGAQPSCGSAVGGSPELEGLRVVSIRPDSPAVKAGLQVGDSILTFDDVEVTSRCVLCVVCVVLCVMFHV